MTYKDLLNKIERQEREIQRLKRMLGVREYDPEKAAKDIKQQYKEILKSRVDKI